MGWWEQRIDGWDICVVAQVGGAAGLGGGAFFLQFRSPNIPVKPIYVAVAAGVGAGGSIGSAISIPWRSLVRQLINPRAVANTNDIGWSKLDGTFSPYNLNHCSFTIGQVGASAAIVGGQFVLVSAFEPHLFSPNVPLFSSNIAWPRSLPQVGSAILDIPQIQGGLGAGAFGFTGSMQYIGC
ncbi:hypothetical protein ACE7GA_20615 [Roseomonas sp. CCTCC AB2023176]|uniref:hypothetical protein n=1 Tax=Roseomonas sp. CCTCC AB2023176 TaxID=3342640 RepID=UPI0035D5B906